MRLRRAPSSPREPSCASCAIFDSKSRTLGSLMEDNPAGRAAAQIKGIGPGVLDFRPLAGQYDRIWRITPEYPTVTVRIEGRVQGVFYRAWTDPTARSLGLTARYTICATAPSRRCSPGLPRWSLRWWGGASTDRGCACDRGDRAMKAGAVHAVSAWSGPIAGADAEVTCPRSRRAAPVDIVHSRRMPSATRLVTACVEPARHDAGEMLEVRVDIKAHPVKRHPMADADADAAILASSTKIPT